MNQIKKVYCVECENLLIRKERFSGDDCSCGGWEDVYICKSEKYKKTFTKRNSNPVIKHEDTKISNLMFFQSGKAYYRRFWQGWNYNELEVEHPNKDNNCSEYKKGKYEQDNDLYGLRIATIIFLVIFFIIILIILN